MSMSNTLLAKWRSATKGMKAIRRSNDKAFFIDR
jgi:hypothetical protein